MPGRIVVAFVAPSHSLSALAKGHSVRICDAPVSFESFRKLGLVSRNRTWPIGPHTPFPVWRLIRVAGAVAILG